ncbi:MAG TPA: hypothetical protein VF993_00185 [Myxococcales bacterium]
MRWVSLIAVLACTSRPPALHDDPQAIAWRSRAKVPDAAAKQIAAEALGDARRRPAWSEPNHVHAADGPIGDGADKYLYGEARLYLGEYETDPGKFREVDGRDDALMAYADGLFTFQQLLRWSREHGVSWDVRLGRLRGRVDARGPDGAAEKLLAELSHRAGGVPAAAAEAARPQLDAKYRDRR